jgi:hypothetical protein
MGRRRCGAAPGSEGWVHTRPHTTARWAPSPACARPARHQSNASTGRAQGGVIRVSPAAGVSYPTSLCCTRPCFATLQGGPPTTLIHNPSPVNLLKPAAVYVLLLTWESAQQRSWVWKLPSRVSARCAWWLCHWSCWNFKAGDGCRHQWRVLCLVKCRLPVLQHPLTCHCRMTSMTIFAKEHACYCGAS